MKLRLTHLALGFAAAASLATTPLRAQQNDRPLRIVVPFASGGSQDVIARYLGAKLTDRLGGPVDTGTRYVTEDMPYGLVFLEALGAIAGLRARL